MGKGATKKTDSASTSAGAIRKRVVIEASEEEQMRLAIENSLRETQDAAASGRDEDVITIDSETEGDDVEEIVSYEFYMGSPNGMCRLCVCVCE